MAQIPKIGVFPSDLEPLMLFADKRFSLCYLVAKNTAEDAWAGKFLPPEQICRYSLRTKKTFEDCSFADILYHSDVNRVIAKNKIEHLWLTVDNEDRSLIKAWAKTNRVKIIGPDFSSQKNLEDKIWFDRFLARHNLPKPASQIYRPGLDALKISGKIVLQAVKSAGSEGTFFINHPADVKGLLAKKIITGQGQYLVREFASGMSCGITVLVTAGTVALSAIRQQCFSHTKSSGQPVFKGIQWLPYKQIKKAEKNINDVFGRLGRILQEQKFFGYANIDFIITASGEIKIIECNPRFSTSTAQLAKMPALISGLKAGNMLINDFIKQKKYADKYKFYPLPRTNYQGCVLNVDSGGGAAMIIKKAPPIGLYRQSGKTVKYLTPDIRKIKNNNEFIYLAFVAEGEKLAPDTTVGLLVCNYRLFTAWGAINREGDKLLKIFNYR